MSAQEKEKKYWIWFAVLLFIIIVFIVYFGRWSHNAGPSKEDPYMAVPTDAFMMFETGDLPAFIKKLSTHSEVWSDLRKIPDIENISRDMEKIDSLFRKHKDLYNFFSGKPLVLSVHDIGKERSVFLGVLRMPGNLRETALNNIFSKVQNKAMTEVRDYYHMKIYQVRVIPDHLSFYYAVNKGLFLFGTSRILLEKGIRQMGSGESIDRNKSFEMVKNTAGKNEEANIYIRPDHLPVVLKRWLSPGFFHRLSSSFPLGGWTELDVSLKEKAILLNGFTIIGDSSNDLLSLSGNADPAPDDIISVIPSSAVSAAILTFRNLKKYQERLEAYRGGGKGDQQKIRNSFEKITGEKPEDVFGSFITLQAALVNMDIRNETDANNTFVVARVESQSRARTEIEAVIKKYATQNHLPVKQFIKTVTFDPETRNTVYHFPFVRIPGLIFGGFTGDYPYPYITFLDNYILWGNSVQSIFKFLKFNILQQTLSHDLDFREFTDGMSMRSNIFYFLKLPEAARIIDRHFSPAMIKSYNRYQKKNIKIKYIGYEAIYQNGMIYNNIYIPFKEKTEKKAVTVWESLLDTVIHYKPQFVINHRTRHKEIFVQDAKNQIYLINASGRILWKVPLREKIMGQAYQIDYYKNNKLQLLFNTRHYLYLIDRNGNFVERFPVSLRSPASNEMALFDYDKNKNYRIFIAGRDKKVYAYDKSGNLIPGWKIKKCESIVTGPVHHYTLASKDYIVFSDTMNLYILDRKGNERVHISGNVPKPAHQNILIGHYPGEKTPAIVLNARNGEIYFVNFSGKVKSIRFPEIPDNAYFNFEDLNGDGTEEFIFLYQDQLQVMKSPEKELFSYHFNASVPFPPLIYVFSAKDKKIGVVDATFGTIYLVNNTGKLYNGFPLKGQTQFTIGRLGAEGNNFNLIVGGNDNFLYNYSVK